jgi:hypothetical protein
MPDDALSYTSVRPPSSPSAYVLDNASPCTVVLHLRQVVIAGLVAEPITKLVILLSLLFHVDPSILHDASEFRLLAALEASLLDLMWELKPSELVLLRLADIAAASICFLVCSCMARA